MTLAEYVTSNEGYVPHAYKDSEGYWTVGIGFLIDKDKGGGLTREECDTILDRRLTAIYEKLFDQLVIFRGLDPVRQTVLVDMSYQLGISGMMNFKKMLAAIEAGDYSTAAKEMLDSLWAKQTPVRAKRNANAMATGILA